MKLNEFASCNRKIILSILKREYQFTLISELVDMAPMQGFVPISGKRQSWEELRKEVNLYALSIFGQSYINLNLLCELGQ